MMPPFAVTPLYAALCGLLLIVLSVRVILLRRRHRVSLGTGGHTELERATRIQANFTEYVPLTLLLLFLLELSRQPVWALHALGLLLVLGRIIHALGLATASRNGGREIGIGLTFTVLTVTSLWLLVVVLQRYL
jgi:uncharacterized membrane protein YecN with MAPEG domain